MPPDELAGDAPLLDVGEPVFPDGGPALGGELDAPAADGLQRGVGGVLDVHEPLLGDQGLQHAARAVRDGHLVGVVLGLLQEVLGLEVLEDQLAAGEAVQAGIARARFLGHLRVEADDRDGGEAQPGARGMVVGIVGGGELHAARAELGIHEVVRDHGDLPVREGQLHLLPEEALEARIVRVHGDARVAQHGLGARGGDHEAPAVVDVGIADVPELAVALLVLHLEVGEGRLARGIPLDHAGALVDAPLLVGLHEDLADGLVEVRVHGEALAGPVHAGAHAAELVLDGALVLVLPGPEALEELLPGQVVAGLALGLQLALHHHLGGDARVVHPGDPEGVEALGALEARQGVVQREHQGVAHVEVARDVGRRDHDRPGLPAALRLGFEDAGFLPGLVPAGLRRLEIEGLVHFSHRFSL